ncbi:MAG: hypothetical protein AB4352_29655 [Hormoscilla sp.]
MHYYSSILPDGNASTLAFPVCAGCHLTELQHIPVLLKHTLQNVIKIFTEDPNFPLSSVTCDR